MRSTALAFLAGSMLAGPAFAQSPSQSVAPSSLTCPGAFTLSVAPNTGGISATLSCPTPVSPPPPPPPPPIPAGSPGEVAAGITANEQLPALDKPRIATSCTPGSCANRLSAVASIQPDAAGGGQTGSIYFTATPPAPIAGFNFTGWTLYADGAACPTLTDDVLGKAGTTNLILAVGTNAPLTCAGVIVDHSIVDETGADAKGLFEAPFRVQSGNVTVSNTTLENSQNDLIDNFGSGTLTLVNDYLHGVGLGNFPGGHVEGVHIFSVAPTPTGRLVMQGGLVDLTGSNPTAGKPGGGWTGAIDTEGDVGGSADIEGVTIKGVTSVQTFYAIQNSMALTLKDNAIQAGSSGYVAHNGGSIAASGNVDDDTGAPINP